MGSLAEWGQAGGFGQGGGAIACGAGAGVATRRHKHAVFDDGGAAPDRAGAARGIAPCKASAVWRGGGECAMRAADIGGRKAGTLSARLWADGDDDVCDLV